MNRYAQKPISSGEIRYSTYRHSNHFWRKQREKKMKRTIVFLMVLVCALGFVSCASGPKVSRIDVVTGEQIPDPTNITGRWNDTAVRTVCETLLTQALDDPSVDRYIKQFTAGHGGDLPSVIVGKFKNDSSEVMDTSIISSNMQSAIKRSGKLEFVAGGDTREELRAERMEQQFNASEDTAALLGNETGANLMMNGSVKSIVERAGSITTRSYFVHAYLTNIESNKVIWDGECNDLKYFIER
jgi:PBP1b-binding outer membrane lipoprotein LpoB